MATRILLVIDMVLMTIGSINFTLYLISCIHRKTKPKRFMNTAPYRMIKRATYKYFRSLNFIDLLSKENLKKGLLKAVNKHFFILTLYKWHVYDVQIDISDDIVHIEFVTTTAKHTVTYIDVMCTLSKKACTFVDNTRSFNNVDPIL